MGKFMNNKKTIGQINGCNVYEVDDFLELTDLEMQISKKDQHRLNLLSEEGKKVYLAFTATKKALIDNQWALAKGVKGKIPDGIVNGIKRRLDHEMQIYKSTLFNILHHQEQGEQVYISTIMRFLGVNEY